MREAKQINDLLGELSGQHSVALISILPKNSAKESLEEIGEWLEEIYQHFEDSVNGINECRISWDKLIILHNIPSPNGFEEELIGVLGSIKHPRLETHCLFDSIGESLDESLRCIDKMQLQLNKIGYWTEHIYDYYYIDGKKVTL